MLRVTGPKSTNACQDYQLCASLKAVIDVAVHGVQDIWDANSSTEYWLFLLVDAKTCLIKFIELERCGRFAIYRRSKPVLFLTVIVADH